jgi:glycosyltransferase involved in cell wall biosynthesis
LLDEQETPMTPKLSIRIPTLNNFNGLNKALESIYAQSFNDKDIIIVDNNSDDGSWKFTKKLPEKYSGLQVIQNNERGLAENWNYCVKSGTGEYLLIFHTDDIMLPGMLKMSVTFLDEHPGVGLVHANCYDITEKSEVLLRVTGSKPILKKGTEALMKIALDCNIACSTVVVRKACYDKLGLFLTGNPSPDAEMWARIVKEYDFGHINEPLVKVTAHIDSYGRAALSELPPATIEKQWEVLGDKIISYFPPEDQPTIRKASKMSGFNGLSAAADIAWRQRRWIRGHRFFLLARKYTTFTTWVKRYILFLLKSVKFVVFNVFRTP